MMGDLFSDQKQTTKLRSDGRVSEQIQQQQKDTEGLDNTLLSSQIPYGQGEDDNAGSGKVSCCC